MAYKPSKLTLREAIDLIRELGGAENPEDELMRAGECGDITATGLIVTVMGGVPWPEINERIPPRFWRYTIYWDENLILQTPYEKPERLNESEKAREIRIKRSEIEAIWGGSNRKDDPQNAAASPPEPKRKKARPGPKPRWHSTVKKFLKFNIKKSGVEYLDYPIGVIGRDAKLYVERQDTHAIIRKTLPKNRQNIEAGCKKVIEEIKREQPENE